MSRVIMGVRHRKSVVDESRRLPVMKMTFEHLASESWLDGWNR